MRRPLLTAVISLTSLLPVLLAPASAARAASVLRTVHASGGGVTATLTYAKRKGTLFASRARITVTDSGRQVYDGPVTKPHCGNYCEFDAQPLSVIQLAGSNDPVLMTYTGGAHCCAYLDIYSPQPSGKWIDTGFNFGDPGVNPRHIGPGGEIEFVTANDAFAYALTDYAESGMPLLILQFNGHGFTDVTRNYPKLIHKDVRLWWTAYQKDHTAGAVGLIAAWAADEDNLGHETDVAATLARQVAVHRISPAQARRLRAFLAKLGYTH